MMTNGNDKSEAIRVAVVDDHQLVARGITEMIDSFDQFKVVLVCSSAAELLQQYEQYRIQIIVSDINMPGMNGIEMAKTVKAARPYLKVLILSYLTNKHYVKNAMESGINGFLSKSCSKAELLEALVSVTGNNYYLGRKVQNIMFTMEKDSADEKKSLSSREFEVLKLIVSGLTSKLIAQELFIDLKTVESHRRNIFKKLEVTNVAQLILTARKQGILFE